MRYSIIDVIDTEDDIDDWRLQPDWISNKGESRRDFRFSGKDAKRKMIKDGFKLIREIDGLQYYREGRINHCILVPETHPLFNFHLLDTALYFNNYGRIPTEALDESIPILVRKYVARLVSPKTKI